MTTAAPLQNLAAKPRTPGNSGHAGLLLQRKCACGAPTASLTGECAECKSKKRLQTKLAIGASHDPLEQEADRVADQVLAAPKNQALSPAPPRIQRFTGQAAGQANAAPASVDRVLSSAGRPLEPALRQDMEQRFGHDFSQVRVHAGTAAGQSAREVNAHAYTAGHDIVFSAGRYQPATHDGRRLIAHELTHVVQQSTLVDATAHVNQLRAPSVLQRQVMPIDPWVRPMPMPMPNVGPIPEIGPVPFPPIMPMPGEFDFEPELEETEDIPEEEEIEEPEDAHDPESGPEAEPPAAEATPQPGPVPVPPVAPNPEPEEKEDQNVCGSKRLPLTKVSWSNAPLGQGGTVRASPLTRCPGNTVGSLAKASTYPDQFRCIKKAGLSRRWLPLHLLHGPSPRANSKLRNLHGPGNERWNIIIGDTKLNGDMYKAVEGFVINRVYDWNQALWLESRVVEHFPGAEFFAKKITLAWGIYNTATQSEGPVTGGGTFENKPENLPPPACAPTSKAGASAVAPGAVGFDTTISICEKSLKSKQPFPVEDGGLELVLRARAQGQDCNISEYSVSLWKFNKNWVDGEFGSKTVHAGKTVKLRWRNLPAGIYYFVFTVGPHNKNCCLKGDMSVRKFFAKPNAPWTA
jgi:hypothetical protein